MKLDIISVTYRFYIRVYYKIQNYAGRKIDTSKASKMDSYPPARNI